MNIPTIYILFLAEFVVILAALAVFIYLRRKKEKTQDDDTVPSIDLSNSYIDFIEAELLKQDELSFKEDSPEEGTGEAESDENSDANAESNEESDADAESDDNEATDTEQESDAGTASDNETETTPTDDKTKLLEIRSKFLNIEKSAAELGDDENAFWEAIYSGMQEINDEFASTKEVPIGSESDDDSEAVDDSGKVLIIENQGKKIDTEVNKLKDIISDQEHILSDLQKALKDAGDDADSANIEELAIQAEKLDKQIKESKMCMDVLELENGRLQKEVDDLQTRYDELFNEHDEESDAEEAPEAAQAGEPENNGNIDQIKETLDKQEQQISELNSTIDKLELSANEAEILKEKLSEFAHNSQEMLGCIAVLEDENEFLSKQLNEKAPVETDNKASEKDAGSKDDMGDLQQVISKHEQQIEELNSVIDDLQLTAEQTERLKSTLNDFAHSSKEMMGCITILEEENDHLQQSITDSEEMKADSTGEDTQKLKDLKSKIKEYEKELIKKDVAYAKIQDELSTIEKEYQAIYEQLHGDN